MKGLYVYLLLLIAILLPSTAIAASCTVNGQNDFTIGFTVTASPARQYVRMYKNANHGFHNDSTGRYDKEKAELAWKRTIEFFNKKLT